MSKSLIKLIALAIVTAVAFARFIYELVSSPLDADLWYVAWLALGALVYVCGLLVVRAAKRRRQS